MLTRDASEPSAGREPVDRPRQPGPSTAAVHAGEARQMCIDDRVGRKAGNSRQSLLVNVVFSE